MGCTVTGTIRDTSGQPYSGIVRFEPWSHPTVNEGLIVGSVQEVATNSLGEFSVGLEIGNYIVRTRGNRPFVISVPPNAGTADITTLISARFTWLTIPPGDGGVLATDSIPGSVRTNVAATNPVVYLTSEVDALVDAASSTAAAAAAQAAASGATANSALQASTTAQASSNAALVAANAAVAAAASFPIASFLGTLTSLGTDPGAAAANGGKWWQIGVDGTLAHANAGGLIVAVGNRILSNGTSWLKYLTPPTYLPDGVVLKSKLSADLQLVTPETEDNAVYLWAVLDSSRFGLAGIRKSDGKMEVALAPDKAQTINDLTAGGARHLADDFDVLWAIKDANGYSVLKVLKSTGEVVGLFSVPELTAARGSRTSLTERLNTALTAYGIPKQAIWGEEFLPETRQRLRKRLTGDAGQLVIAAIGDSWTHNYQRYTGPLTTALQTTYGTAGAGWCGFAWPSGFPTLTNGSVNPTRLSFSVTGTWTPQYAAAATPDISTISSSGVGDKVTVAGPASASGARLFWVGATSASVRYRWDGGSWTTLSVATAGTNSSVLAGMPATAWTLEIEVVAGTPLLSGLDVQSTANGITCHKLGSTGSTAASWTAVNATQWQTAFALLDPHLVILMFGTNDQAAYDESVFSGHIQTLITRIRTARPVADILLVAPCENLAGRARSMALYADKLRTLAVVNSCAFLDLQPFFGTLPPNYGSGSSRPWFNADTFHPDPTTGGRAIVDAIARVLTT